MATRYIVRFKDAAVPLYTGGIAGLKATSPHVTGARILEARAPRALSYARYLKSRHAEFLDHAQTLLRHRLTPHFEYRYALNGLSVNLTKAEAKKLSGLPEVASVEPVRYYRPATTVPATASDTAASRAWIKAPDIWSLPTFDTGAGIDTEGEGVVVADIDTGINSGNSSFAATGADGYTIQNPLGSGVYLGVCDPANTDQWSKKPAFFQCNDKLIGAYTYTNGTNDPNSPEDSEGHGSHTASIAAGDPTTADINGVTMPLSGVAPHANIIAYDVCNPTDLCSSDAVVAAVDQAIKDQGLLSAKPGFKGMVINYSIGGGDNPYSDPVSQAFLSAVEAGIYVSASAGNGGPGNAVLNDPSQLYAVEHVGPWVASTAATTHDGSFSPNSLETFSGGDSTTLPAASMAGAGITGAFGPAPIIYAGDGNYVYSPYPGSFSISDIYPLSGENYVDPADYSAAQAAAECLYPFAPGTFPSGTIVVCDRGDIALVDKVDNAKQGGAAAVVIATTAASSQDMPAVAYELPATLIGLADGDTLRAWLNASTGTGTAQAALSGATPGTDATAADEVANFSSRGPAAKPYDSLLKPNLAAPGVGVLAAVSNPAYTDGVSGGANQPETFDFYDGTSMASPHDAGAAALLRQLHPQWTPAEIQSALMLTAVTSGLTDQCASLDSADNCIAGTSVPSPLVRGAGRIDVSLANRTGIVLDESGSNFEAADPADGGDLTKLNLAGLANDNCVITCQWTRTLTSALASASATYTVSASAADSGLKLSVSPANFTLAPGATQALTVTADVSGLPTGQWTFGQVVIQSADAGDGGQPIAAMHLPIAIQPEPARPVMKLAPSQLNMSVTQNDRASVSLNIENSGPGALNWALALQGDSGSVDLWTQPNANTNTGLPSSFFTPDGHGVYSADKFVMPGTGTLTRIVADGFAQTDTALVDLATDATAIDWYIYADANGQPAGSPDDGLNDYVWHFSTAPTASGVDTTNGAVTLDLAAAGRPAVVLKPGTYWLIVSPAFNAQIDDPHGPAWYWFEGSSADGAKSALLIDSGNTFGYGTDWQTLDDSLAYTLTGTLDCSGAQMSGLSFGSTSGTVAPNTSHILGINFNADNIATGRYIAPLCITGDDPKHPLSAVPLTITVQPAPADTTPADTTPSSGKGGGGGGFGALAICLLGLAVAERRRGASKRS
ncbi:MAG TPA: S8 family serine peptidase [Gammaproteobacteria bacterium]|nr:S8 family serine peptidase [Gammaproteobacteria bacterium]